MGIRSRIFVIVSFLFLIGISLTFVIAERDLNIEFRDQIEGELSKQARILQQSLQPYLIEIDKNKLKTMIDQYAQASKSRITIINTNGLVVADSSVTNTNLGGLDNHSTRPEILQALSEGEGSSKRYSITTQQEMLYFAILDSSLEELNFIRVSVPYEYVDQLLGTLDNSITLIFVVGLIVAIIASLMAGDYTRQSLVELEAAVSKISSGTYRKKNIKSLPTSRRDEIGSMARNISSISMDLKNQISLIAKQRDQFGSVLDDLGEGIMVMSETGEITFCNDQMHDIFHRNELVGKSINDLNIKAINQLFKQTTNKGKHEIEFELETEGEDTRWILAHMNKASTTKEFILVVHETTYLRQMDSMRRDFISNLSHELRTPVSVIKANSETLLDGALENSKDAKLFSKAILHNANRLSEMVSSLIDLSRIEYGELKFVIEDININSIISTVISSYKNMTKKKNIQLKFEDKFNSKIKADAKAVERVINNLIDNALKYSPEGSVIEIKLKKQGKFLRISVLDLGEGVLKDEQELVFKRFFRTARARAKTQQGSGLGLAIVKHLVNNLQGEVGVQSRKEKGSEFWFTLPLS
jgi:two-component system phosphate regulon sensor histidine kinase PhoR